MVDDNKANNSNNKKRYNNKKKNFKKPANNNRRPKTLSASKIAQKYDNLLEQHIQARAKFYHLYGRSKKTQFEKAKSLMEKTRAALHGFEKTLKDWQQEALNTKLCRFPEDLQFSTTHEVSPLGDIVEFVGDFYDPHLLQSQIESSYQSDTEESSGSIDDYAAYKESR